MIVRTQKLSIKDFFDKFATIRFLPRIETDNFKNLNRGIARFSNIRYGFLLFTHFNTPIFFWSGILEAVKAIEYYMIYFPLKYINSGGSEVFCSKYSIEKEYSPSAGFGVLDLFFYFCWFSFLRLDFVNKYVWQKLNLGVAIDSSCFQNRIQV